MFYDTLKNKHGLRHDPWKAVVVPRPIGWISTVSKDGINNIAPYSFFNAIGSNPHYVMFSSGGRKDSVRNAEESGEFVCSLATWDLRHEMNATSAELPHGVDEFPLAKLTTASSQLVRPPRVSESPISLECRYWKTIDLPNADGITPSGHMIVLGMVVGIYIDDAFIKDGMVDTAGMRPIARLGYMDYAVVTPETTFTIHRPKVDNQGNIVLPEPTE